jgi:hypothetical protein
LQHEILGNWYKNLDGVEYIDNEKKLIDILKLIKDGKYRKKNKRRHKAEKSRKEFLNTVKLLEYLFRKNKHL